MNSLDNRLSRRRALFSVAAVCAAPAFLIGQSAQTLSAELKAIETRSKGRLGVAVLDTANSKTVGLRTAERFPMCSTFKLLAVAFVLQRVDQGKEQLERKIAFSAQDLLSYAPVTEKQVAAGSMTVAELCAAAITLSDNTAANLLLASFGGPEALTRFLRRIGDPTTRLDRNEPTLNTAVPGDPRDTTTPAAMVETVRRLTLGSVLTPASRARLCDWLIACSTGTAKLRAGFPSGTRIGDKTGSGDHGTNNDVALVWLPARKPVLIASYLTESPLATPELNAIHADVARAVFAALPVP